MINTISNPNKQGAISWNTTVFMILFHAGAIASLFMLSWSVVPATLSAVVDFRKFRGRDGFSPFTDPPRV